MIRCCKGCIPPERHKGCHSTCPDYISESRKHNEEREERYQMRKIDWDFDDYNCKNIQKNAPRRSAKFRKKDSED